MSRPHRLAYLLGYPPAWLAVETLIAQAPSGRLGGGTPPRASTPCAANIALVDCVQGLKARHLRSAPLLAKVAWDPQL